MSDRATSTEGVRGTSRSGRTGSRGAHALAHGREACFPPMRQGVRASGRQQLRSLPDPREQPSDKQALVSRNRAVPDPTGSHVADRLREKAQVRQITTELGGCIRPRRYLVVGLCVGIGTGSKVEERYGIGSSVVVGVQVGIGAGSGVEER